MTHPCELWMNIREVTVGEEYNVDPPNGLDNWMPPPTKSAFRVERETEWLKWSHGRITRGERCPPNLTCSDITSMFWSPDRQGFIQAPVDCTDFNPADNEVDEWRDWTHLSFEQPGNDELEIRTAYPNLWRIGYRLRETHIKAQMTAAWEDLLGPTYFDQSSIQPYTLSTCEFAGSLSILLGLFTLAVTWDRLQDILETCFQPTCGDTLYIPRRFYVPPGSKTARRGVIIKVAYDAARYHKDQIEAWKLGRMGPILTSLPSFL